MFHQGELRILAGAVVLFFAGLGWKAVHANALLPPLEVRGVAIEWNSSEVGPGSNETERAVPASAPHASPPRQAILAGKIDPNTATAAQLESLPGIGPSLALRILEARASQPFHSLADLDRVKGIGPSKLEKLRPLLLF